MMYSFKNSLSARLTLSGSRLFGTGKANPVKPVYKSFYKSTSSYASTQSSNKKPTTTSYLSSTSPSSTTTPSAPSTTYTSSSISNPVDDASAPSTIGITENRTLSEALGAHSIDNDNFPPKIPEGQIDWATSYHGLGTAAFESKINELLLAPLAEEEVEITPDGLLYLPEIKYRRILNKAFGPGGWGLAPRSETIVTPKSVTREYALICQGRLVSVARGEQDYFGEQNIPTATEGCKSNALMRCCKDLGIASELWDPSFVRKFKKAHCEEKFVEHVVNKRKRKLWKRKDASFEYPYKVC